MRSARYIAAVVAFFKVVTCAAQEVDTDKYWSERKRVGPVQSARSIVPLPSFDVEASCRKITSENIGYAECIRREQLSYDLLKIEWERLNPSSQEYCLKPAAAQPLKYVWLRACFEGQIAIQRMNTDRAAPPRFRY